MSPMNTTLDFQRDSNGEWWLLAKNSFYFLQDVRKYTVYKHMHSKFAKISTIDMGYQKHRILFCSNSLKWALKCLGRKLWAKNMGRNLSRSDFARFVNVLCLLLLFETFFNLYGNNLNRHKILFFFIPHLWNLWETFLLSPYLYILQFLAAYSPKMEHCQIFCRK